MEIQNCCCVLLVCQHDYLQCYSDAGRQSTGPIAAFLRPVPAAQPEAEAKSQAALLAAAAAAAGMAHSSLQAGAVQAAVQVCLTPAADDTGCRALPALQQPFLSCPINMTIQELCQVRHAGFGDMAPLLPTAHVYDSAGCC